MARRILLDADVLLEAALGDGEGRLAALAVIDDVAFGCAQGLVAANGLVEVGQAVSQRAARDDAEQLLLALMDVLEVVPVDGPLCRMAAHQGDGDYGAAVLRTCAESAAVDFVVSGSRPTLGPSPVRCLTPQGYVELFCDSELLDPGASEGAPTA